MAHPQFLHRVEQGVEIPYPFHDQGEHADKLDALSLRIGAEQVFEVRGEFKEPFVEQPCGIVCNRLHQRPSVLDEANLLQRNW